MKNTATIILLLVFAFSANAQPHPIVDGHTLQHRLVRISTNFLVDANLPPALETLTDAAAHCYNGVIIHDSKFGFLEDFTTFSNNYFQNLHTFLDSAKTLGMAVFPETVPFGYSSPILWHNPNLAEGLPVIDAPFVVQGSGSQKILVNLQTDTFDFENPDFEEEPTFSQNEFPGWSWQDGPGTVTFWDENEAKSGNASARVSNPQDAPSPGNARIVQSAQVAPFRDYHIRFWVKTQDFDPAFVNVYILSNTNRALQFNPIQYAPTQDWTQYDLTFNTLDANTVLLYFGVWNGGSGDLWWDDISIQPTRFNNIVRRAGAPVSLTTPSGNVLLEGVDTDSIFDPLCGVDPWPGAYSIWHEQPLVGVPESSDLVAGDVVLVSYYHTATLNGGQVCAALTEPEVFDITYGQLASIREEFLMADLFEGWFLQYDEIRIHNWDEAPSYGSPGDDLAFNFNAVYEQARELDDEALVMTWSDMFDPYHNAYETGDPYYLVEGLWSGSWEGVPDDVVILNWNGFADRVASAQFFAERGHPQILAGYYDTDIYYTPDWLAELEGTAGISGVMYTTWTNNYDQMGTWAEAVWGGCSFETGISQTSKAFELLVYPNPASDRIFMQIPEGTIAHSVELLNGQGKVVRRQALGPGRWMDVSGLPVGLYTLRWTSANGIGLGKIAIQ